MRHVPSPDSGHPIGRSGHSPTLGLNNDRAQPFATTILHSLYPEFGLYLTFDGSNTPKFDSRSTTIIQFRPSWSNGGGQKPGNFLQ